MKWTNEELLGMIGQQQELTATMLGKMSAEDSTEELLESVIAKQREIDHLIDRLIEDDTAGSAILLELDKESADTVEPDEKSSAS